jgi:hypothetical protein
MKRKKKNQFRKSTLKLKKNHTWTAPDGYKVIVLDRGAVSFNVPVDWVVAKTEPFELNDAEPPEDEARLTISFWRTAPGIDWSALPLDDLLVKSADGGDLDILEKGAVNKVPRDDLELVWTYQRFLDAEEKREAFTRIAVARGWDVYALITSDFWVDDLARLEPIWAEVLRSLQLGRTIEDPTRGAVLQ